ncbi:hypothetical protein, variant 2 [Aphanomyces invadans]|uniref:Uncharacterized protein n=3 Tax=Aphanomyces invadans TaxID=157072 RepID=A0A024TMT2_9STRA|nr:hypothetical protein, variant 2 [Aphanomyces invadans]ETV95445.1 hypothetical protein, variant 2 [Aphanomyces invadans]|eukprot:XP_008876146.1 hypothetical protein, variant 2 [Aphanomyces invadans]
MTDATVDEEMTLMQTPEAEDKEMERQMRDLETYKEEIEFWAQECVKMETQRMQSQRMHQELQAEVRVIVEQINYINAELIKETNIVDLLKQEYSQQRSKLLDLVPASTSDVDHLAEVILHLANRPKLLHQELDQIRRHKNDLQQQILLQDKNINALERLSLGQASRVESLEKDIVELEGILYDTEVETRQLRESYKLLMHQIHHHREQVPKPHRDHRTSPIDEASHECVHPIAELVPEVESIPHSKPHRNIKDKFNQTAADLIQSFQKRRCGNTSMSSKRQKTARV